MKFRVAVVREQMVTVDVEIPEIESVILRGIDSERPVLTDDQADLVHDAAVVEARSEQVNVEIIDTYVDHVEVMQ